MNQFISKHKSSQGKSHDVHILNQLWKGNIFIKLVEGQLFYQIISIIALLKSGSKKFHHCSWSMCLKSHNIHSVLSFFSFVFVIFLLKTPSYLPCRVFHCLSFANFISICCIKCSSSPYFLQTEGWI